MNTLPNVHTRENEATTHRADLDISIIPEAKTSTAGVSVKYAPSPDKNWYVLRASYGRMALAADILIGWGEYVFLPMHSVRKRISGRLLSIQEPLLPNLLFAYLTEDMAEKYVRHTPSLALLSYYYNHFKTIDGKNPPLTIPEKEMLNFIRATSVPNEHIKLLNASQISCKKGDFVQVVDGAFTGVRGQVARVAGQQRVIVTLAGVCTVATAYIPTAFLKVIEE